MLRRYYPLNFEWIPLGLVCLVIYLTLSAYPNLPDRIPTHFNFEGFPDGWGSKNELFIYVGMCIFIYLLITAISIAFALVKDPKRLINLPTKIKDSLSKLRAEELRIILLRCLFAIKILALGLNAYLVSSNIDVAHHQVTGIGFWPLFFVMALLIVIGFMIYKSYRIARTTDGT